MGRLRGLEEGLRASGQRGRQRIRDDRFDYRARPSAQRWSAQKKRPITSHRTSKGGLSTKIHATVDALGNPIGFHLTEGQACELDGADVLLPQLEATTVIADKGFDADKRVLEPLQQAGKKGRHSAQGKSKSAA
jgi:hypothetical protein